MYKTLSNTYSIPKSSKVCIFDVDNTLTHGAKANNTICPNV